MRYVFYAFIGLGLMATWMNTTVDGARAKKHLLGAQPHPANQ